MIIIVGVAWIAQKYSEYSAQSRIKSFTYMYQCITVHVLIFMFGYRAIDWGAVDWVIIILFSAMHCLDIGNCSGGTDSTYSDGMSKMAASLLGWEWRG